MPSSNFRHFFDNFQIMAEFASSNDDDFTEKQENCCDNSTTFAKRPGNKGQVAKAQTLPETEQL